MVVLKGACGAFDDNDGDGIGGSACGAFHLLGQRVMDLVSGGV